MLHYASRPLGRTSSSSPVRGNEEAKESRSNGSLWNKTKLNKAFMARWIPRLPFTHYKHVTWIKLMQQRPFCSWVCSIRMDTKSSSSFARRRTARSLPEWTTTSSDQSKSSFHQVCFLKINEFVLSCSFESSFEIAHYVASKDLANSQGGPLQ